MSGGHWDYYGIELEHMLDQIGNDSDVKKRFPKLSEILIKLGNTLYITEHTLDLDLSGDTIIKNDTEFENKTIKELEKCIKC